jgi:predicted dehydrogenase
LRVYGERGGLDWAQERPDDLVVTLHGEPSRILRRGGPGTAQAARVPAGHPEGYLEAFATIYADAARAIRAAEAGQAPDMTLLPGLEAGLDGMRFIIACTRSSAANASWVALDPGDASNGR